MKSIGSTSYEPLNSKSNINFNKLMGVWFEVARLETIFEDRLHDIKHLWVRDVEKPNSFKMVLTGLDKNNVSKTHDARAFFSNINVGRLDVEFVIGIKTEFVIMEILEDYNILLMATENRQYFWILSR